MIACPVCRHELADVSDLARHFWKAADESDVRHVMWLNRHVGLREIPVDLLREKLARALGL